MGLADRLQPASQPQRAVRLSVCLRVREKGQHGWIDGVPPERSDEFDKLPRLVGFVGANSCLDSIRVFYTRLPFLTPP